MSKAKFIKLIFSHNFQMGPISYSVCNWLTFLGFCKLQLVGSICKLWRKFNAVIMAQGTIFTTLIFLCNLQIAPIDIGVPLQPNVMQHSSLLGQFISYKESVVNIAPGIKVPIDIPWQVEHATGANAIKLFSAQLSRYRRNPSQNIREICHQWHELCIKKSYNIGHMMRVCQSISDFPKFVLRLYIQSCVTLL